MPPSRMSSRPFPDRAPPRAGDAGARAPRSGWALARGSRELYDRFRADAAALPRDAWLSWGRTLLVGALLCAGLMASVTHLARGLHDRGMAGWDRALLLRIERLPLSFDAAIWWEAFGSSSLLIPIVAVAFVLSVRARRPILASELLAAFLIGKPIFLTGWQLWNRVRPDLIAGGVAAPPLHSFPSGHAFQSVAIYGLLAYLWLRRSSSVVERALGVCAWLALATMVGVARLRLGVHWPSDVLAGGAAGLAWLGVLIVALRRAEAAEGR